MQQSQGNPRIPEALQAVFLQSQRGHEVNKPPPGGVAFKTFRWLPRKRSSACGFAELSDDLTESSYSEVSLSPMRSSRKFALPSPLSPRKNKLRLKREESQHRLYEAPVSPVQTKGNKHISPQAYLTSNLKCRNYNTTSHSALKTSYYNRPTAFQLASYGPFVESLVEKDDIKGIQQLIQGGVSANACDSSGHTLLHRACRLGFVDLARALVELGASVDVVDDKGRTPLHEAATLLSANAELMDLLLRENPRLLYLANEEGLLPLECVSQENWTVWTRYFMSRKSELWPERSLKTLGLQPEDERALEKPNSHPLREESFVYLPCLSLVAEGRLHITDAARLGHATHPENVIVSEDSHDDDDYDDDEYDSYDSEDDFDEDEMAEILGCIGGTKPVAWVQPRRRSSC